MAQTRYDFGGEGQVMHLAVANGFPPQTYVPMASAFVPDYEMFAYLPRPLWEPSPAPGSAPSWQVMGDDILRGLDAASATGIIGIGHSMGGVGTVVAAAKEPERFRGIVLLDPVILHPWLLASIAVARPIGLFRRNRMVKGALNRKAIFGSPEEAFGYWRDKSLFADWSDDMLQRYVDGLLQPEEHGYSLRWSPEWEAHYYATLETTTWHWLRKLKDKVPILAIRGSTSNTFFPSAVRVMERRLPLLTVKVIEGHGHLFPQSAPELTGQIIASWLAETF
jgi:pimeloyl-ACP methyl ester carboxylesterase